MNQPDIKLYPGSYIPDNATHHVCTTEPKPGGSNHEGVCATCGAKLFFQDEVPPKLIKICWDCYEKLAQTKEVESVGNVDSLTKAVLRHLRN